MAYQTASASDVESVVDEEYGGMWFLKEPLEASELGVSVLELEPGARGMEHDESGTSQEEVYVCVDGEATFEIAGDTVTVGENEAVRVDAETTRQVFNRGEERLRLVIAGAPTSADA
ncbi:cupin domain-containing protein [Halocalculus aciditolerans]|uniref:Cupin type-2 domain-containing protein n=1 Tax=Halocalculus aciditolerans TaxID=1383812 RepID=A0A830FG80_9EURY|nr:cupin domain-containing protein [Halocalculus aciditolerans]GGL52344.1 hypothetical protein GCM10009039_08270 [Halocalculus aciditolerans]